ncbi:MAG: tRNA pseudouridine(55) synthase TruB [Caldilineaceae bacterium]|nr:tRNA pseudouridine(55) synthase TruB [Caldilineaceae bacterium]
MARKSSSLTGLLAVDKPGLPFDWQEAGRPAGAYDLPTSHDVVQRVRRLSGQRRIGHTGTLDPMASGVLVLCLGQVTRLVEYYQGHAKRYLAEVTLGAATDTYDALGQIIAARPVPFLTQKNLEEVLDAFRGGISQRPPIFSALKQGGESLHRKARRGESVEVEARPITIHDLTLVDWIKPNRLRIRVHGSAGTYVRSLAHDLGEALGTAAHLSGLRREAAGEIALADAYTLDQLEAEAPTFDEQLRPPGWALSLPVRELDDEAIRRLGFGQQVCLPHETTAAESDVLRESDAALAQGIDANGSFAGIMRRLAACDDGSALWKAEKWFAGG